MNTPGQTPRRSLQRTVRILLECILVCLVCLVIYGTGREGESAFRINHTTIQSEEFIEGFSKFSLSPRVDQGISEAVDPPNTVQYSMYYNCT